MMLVKLDSDMQKNEPGPLVFTIHTNKFKMDERPQCKTHLTQHISRGKGNQNKNELLEPHQNKFLHSEGNNQ